MCQHWLSVHDQAACQLSQRALLMCTGLQVNGHFMAQLDPLGIDVRPVPVELDPALYGFSDKDLDRE